MSNMLKGCTVTFESDFRKEEADFVLSAIRMIKGVAGVGPLAPDPTDWMARERVRFEAYEEAVKALRSVFIEKGK